MSAAPPPDSGELARILLLQSTLQATPDEPRLTQVLARGLAELPGIAGAVTCLDRETRAIGARDVRPLPPCTSDHASTTPDRCPCHCPAELRGNVRRFDLRTVQRSYGALFLDVRDAVAFAPYVPFVENTANLVALHIENTRSTAALAAGKRTLEDQVQQRTAALRSNEARLRILFEQAADPIYVCDVTGQLTQVNHQACATLGYTETELLGLRVFDVDAKLASAEELAELFERLAPGQSATIQSVHRRKDGATFPVEVNVTCLETPDGPRLLGLARDVTERRRYDEALQKRILALTRPSDAVQDVGFEELFDIEDVQRLQDQFATATGVASVITRPDGTPITQPSNFCRLCKDVIRKSEKGLANCFRSDAVIGRYHPGGPVIQPCLSGGLWDAGAAIAVGGQHVANWLIGQVRDETQTEEHMRAYAREIDVDEETMIAAFREVPAMSRQQFEQVAQVLATLAEQLSQTAFQNLQQARFIAERKQAEVALENRRIELEQIFDALPDALVYSDVERRIIRVNPAFVLIFGYQADEVLGQETRVLYAHPEQFDEQGRKRFNVNAAGTYLPYEIEYRRKDGEVFPSETVGTPVRDTDDRVIGYLGLIRDISERARAQQELRRSGELLDEMGSIARIGGWEHDLTADTAAWTRGIYDIVEIEPGQPIPGPSEHLDFYEPEDRERLRQAYERAVATGEPFDLELRCNTATGRPFWARAIGRPVFEDGRCTKVRGTFQDVTPRKHAEEEREKLEEQLRHSQKMEAIGQLAGGVAHDFNNILTAILGNTELAIGDVEAQFPAARSLLEGMHQIEQGAQRAAALTRQLLAFSRRQVIRPQLLDLNTTIRDLEKMLRRLITEDISLHLHCAPDLHLAKADPGQLEQVIVNLVVNARDALSGGGTLTLETRNVTLDDAYVAAHADAERGPHVLLAVSDTGCGMDAATASRVFEPFFTTKPTGEGTGLGLSTVYGIVRQSGGSVAVYSEPGRGTTFKIYLPAAPETATVRSQPAASSQAPAGTETIMVCEDDVAVRELAAHVLKDAGYTVLAASDAGNALHLAASHPGPVHVLVTDVIMPDMNGRKLADALRALRPKLRTLFVSGYTSNVIVHHGVLDDDVDFLEKPYSRRQLLDRVREILDRPRAAADKP